MGSSDHFVCNWAVLLCVFIMYNQILGLLSFLVLGPTRTHCTWNQIAGAGRRAIVLWCSVKKPLLSRKSQMRAP